MGLYDRLAKPTDVPPGLPRDAAAAALLGVEPDGELVDLGGPETAAATRGRSHDSDRLTELRRRMHEALISKFSAEGIDVDQSAESLEARVVEELNDALLVEGTPLSRADRAAIIESTLDDMLRLGPIQAVLEDPTVTEVMVNAPDAVYIEVGGRLVHTDITFRDNAHVLQTIDRIVSRVGRRIDESSPYVDARLPDGSRVNAIVPPIAVDSPTLTIRKFAESGLSANDMVQLGSLTAGAKSFLEAVVQSRLNVLVSGGTGAGKTTTLNALSNFIPATERIITIEDAAELRLDQPHVIRLEHRPPNIEGRGEVSIRDLVRNALRMRPDRIIVGEVRGGEALDMLQAMNTGHDGSLSTAHANSPRDVLSRLETMVLMSGVDLPLRAIREQIASAIQLIVHQTRLADGSRRFTHITEITGMEGDTITMQDVFLFDFHAGRDADGRFRGTLKPTGIRPKVLERITDFGIDLPVTLFGDDDDVETSRGW